MKIIGWNINGARGKSMNLLNNKTFNENSEPRLKGNSIVNNEIQTEIKNGVFTTCKKRDDCPPWELSAERIVHDKKNKITKIVCLNNMFDPNFHQAMLEVEDSTKEKGTIVQEIQKGYMMKSRLLRPSLVGVTKKREQKDKKTKTNETKSEKNNEKK